MEDYRITKYDPTKRNEKGHYLDHKEWTAISDIGKTEYNSLSYEQYEKVENSYIESLMLIVREVKIDYLKIDSLEKHNDESDFQKFKKDGRLKNVDVDYDKEIDPLKNGVKILPQNLPKLIKLILRETLWMKLDNPNLSISFGYDYYMYVKCLKLSDEIKNQITKLGLFIE